MEPPLLHLTRGTLNPKTLDQARTMHNAFVTEGPQPGIEVARSLGDLSHTLYTPAETTAALSDAKPGELLFIDYWAEPSGMETFFSNPFAQQAGERLFSSREESEWTPAPAAFTFQVPAPAGTPARFLRMLRAPVRSAEEATAVPGKLVWANLGAARRRGQLSHSLFVRPAGVIAARPASNARRSAGKNLPGPDRAGGDPHHRVLGDAGRAQRALRPCDRDQRPRRRVGRTAGGVGLGAGERLRRVVTELATPAIKLVARGPLTVSNLGAELGLSAATVRYYERLGAAPGARADRCRVQPVPPGRD
jgi:hypothetical protein